jgi:uncharacterized protein
MISKLKNINIILFSFTAVVITLIGIFIINRFLFNEIPNLPEDIKKMEESKFLFFIEAIVLVPLLETFIFQKVVIDFSTRILNRFNKETFYLPIIISSILFSVEHFYDIMYFFNGLYMGIIFAFCYKIITLRKENPLFIVTVIHSFVNLLPVIRDIVLT